MNWQPIETVPKDGSWVLLYHHDSCDYLMAQWFHGAWWGKRTQSGRAITWRTASHWMPLPEPPK